MRTHPVTGWKTLYVNENFTKEIVGLEKRFSDVLLDSLNRTVAEAYEYQVRWKWTENAVAIWDNRATFHTGIFDYCEWLFFGGLVFGSHCAISVQRHRFETNYLDPHLRHGLRVAPQAEKPYFDPGSRLKRESLAKWGRKEWKKVSKIAPLKGAIYCGQGIPCTAKLQGYENSTHSCQTPIKSPKKYKEILVNDSYDKLLCISKLAVERFLSFSFLVNNE